MVMEFDPTASPKFSVPTVMSWFKLSVKFAAISGLRLTTAPATFGKVVGVQLLPRFHDCAPESVPFQEVVCAII